MISVRNRAHAFLLGENRPNWIYEDLGEHPINTIGNPLIQSINESLKTFELLYPGLVIANGYVIGLNPYNLIPGDIHPSITSHTKLAEFGLKAFKVDYYY